MVRPKVTTSSLARFSRHSVLLNYPFLKIFANRAFHAIAALLFGRRISGRYQQLENHAARSCSGPTVTSAWFCGRCQTGLQPIVLGYKVKHVPISWINRTPGMGVSSFRLVHVGGGYWSVLIGLWLRHIFGVGPYCALLRHSPYWRLVLRKSPQRRSNFEHRLSK